MEEGVDRGECGWVKESKIDKMDGMFDSWVSRWVLEILVHSSKEML